MCVLDGSTVLTNGVSEDSFGSTGYGRPVTKTFSIENTGTGTLTLAPSSLILPGGFSLVTPFASSVAAGGATRFTIALSATTVGAASGTVSFSDNDDADGNDPFQFTVTGSVNAPAAPAVQLDPDYLASPVDYSGAFHAGRGPVPIATADAAVLWPEDLASIAVTITDPLDGSAESLSADTAGTAITAAYSDETLTLSGADTAADYEQVLRSVSYNDTAADPSLSPRTISVTATDGTYTSPTATATLTMVPDQPPVVSDFSIDVGENAGYSFVSNSFAARYAQAQGFPLAAVTITALPTEGGLELSGESVVQGQVIPASELASLSYAAAADYTGPDGFRWNASDGVFYAQNDAGVSIDVTDLAVVGVADTQDATQGAADGIFTFTRSDSQGELTVPYFIDQNAGTAQWCTNYSDPVPSGTVTFYAGQSTATLAVVPYDNLGETEDQTVVLDLAGGDGYTLAGNGSATLTIHPAAAVSGQVLGIEAVSDLAQTPLTLSETALDQGWFRVFRYGTNCTEGYMVNYTVSGTAVAGTDYAALSGTVYMEPDESCTMFDVSPLYHAAGLEGARNVVVTLSRPAITAWAVWPARP